MTTPFRRVLDVTVTLLVEVYQELGLKFDETMDQLEGKLTMSEKQPIRRTRSAPEAQNNESLAMLSAMMAGSDFQGMRR